MSRSLSIPALSILLAVSVPAADAQTYTVPAAPIDGANEVIDVLNSPALKGDPADPDDDWSVVVVERKVFERTKNTIAAGQFPPEGSEITDARLMHVFVDPPDEEGVVGQAVVFIPWVLSAILLLGWMSASGKVRRLEAEKKEMQK